MPEIPQSVMHGNRAAHVKAHALATNPRSHALLLTGAKGIGKSGFACHLAALLFGAARWDEGRINPEVEHPAFRQMQNGSHSDFLLIDSPRYALKSDQIPLQSLGDIHNFVRTRGLASRKIVVIDALDDCVPALQHGLLKLLEEPPKGVLFLLIVHRLGVVLDTVRSRCLRVSFQPLSHDEIIPLLPDHLRQPELLTRLVGGKPGQIDRFTDTDFDEICRIFGTFLETADAINPHLVELVERLCRTPETEVNAFRLLLRLLGHTLLREQVTSQNPPQPVLLENLLKPFRSAPPKPALLAEMVESSLTLIDKINRPPAYLAPEPTLQKILLGWHVTLHHRAAS